MVSRLASCGWRSARAGAGAISWVFDVHVKDAYRGRGYGREAMLLAEAEARRRGLGRVVLNAFGGTEVARNSVPLARLQNAVFLSKDL